MPFTTYCTDAAILAKTKNLIKKGTGATIPSFITDNITEYNQKAYLAIVGELLARGYSAVQTAGWDRGAEFNLDIATYWAIQNAGVTEYFDPEELNKLNRIDELRIVPITVGGELAGVTLVATETDYGTNYSMGKRASFGTAINFTDRKYKPDRFDKFVVRELDAT